jgi:DNA mismatch endonuclease, patch repair protein
MTDVHTAKQRRYNMSRIRASDTKPEMVIRHYLYTTGQRGYRLNYPLFGKPDIVYVKKKLAIFIDGCFWHRCPLCFVIPATHRDFWMKKIRGNVKRDRLVTNELKKNGWVVIRLWEHEVKRTPEKCVRRIVTIVKRKRIRIRYHRPSIS